MFNTTQISKTYTIEKVNVDEDAIINSISKCIGIDEREITIDYDNWDFNTDDIELSPYFSGMIIVFIHQKISDEAKVKLQDWLDTSPFIMTPDPMPVPIVIITTLSYPLPLPYCHSPIAASRASLSM